MSSTIAGLYGQSTQSRNYRYQAQSAMLQAEQARIVGQGRKNAAYAQAKGIEESERKNAELRGQQMRQVRKQQRAAAGAADTAMADSGFSVSEGTGSAAHEASWQQFDEYIDNMAMSSSISSTNALQQAIDTRKSGDSAERMGEVNAIGYEAQATQYNIAAKAMKSSMLTGAISSGIGAVVGGVTSVLSGGGLSGGLLGAFQGANTGWSISTGAGGWSNPYSNYDSGLGNLAALFTMGNYNNTLGWTPGGVNTLGGGYGGSPYYSGFTGRART